MVVETMKKEHLRIYAAMQEFGINDHISEEYYDSNEASNGVQGATSGIKKQVV